MRRQLGVDVLTAARQRISAAFDLADRVSVSFSAGKDSTVMLHLVMQEAIRRGRRVSVLLIDLEAQYKLTIEHALACFELYKDHIDPYWVALPLNLRNAVSQFEPQWLCWDPDRRSDWVREPPPIAITDGASLPFFHPRMEFEEFVPLFAEHIADGRSTCTFVGIRTQESLNRWRSIVSAHKERVSGYAWTTRKSDACWNAYPLYDWTTEDIWTFHAQDPDLPSNGIYDLMHRAGLTIHQARICQPYGDDQRRGLWLYHLLEPETWGRVVARVNGANQGALYARDSGNILGVGKVTCPEGHTWQSYAGLLLDSMPAPTAAHYRDKIETFLKWWLFRGYIDGIPDEADPGAEAGREVPSWRRICKALLRNDYWCKGLSFSQHKSTDSYARYRALMDRTRAMGGSSGAAFAAGCGPEAPGRPTVAQLALIAAMTGGNNPDHAWRSLGLAMGCSAAVAKRRGTRDDATRAIEELRRLNEASG